jgi:hypothetical protein
MSTQTTRHYEFVAQDEDQRTKWIHYMSTMSLDNILRELKLLRRNNVESTKTEIKEANSEAKIMHSARSSIVPPTPTPANPHPSGASQRTSNTPVTSVYNPDPGFCHVLAINVHITASVPISLPIAGLIMSKDCWLYVTIEQTKGSQLTEWVPVTQFSPMVFHTCLPVNMKYDMRLSLYLVTAHNKEYLLYEETLSPGKGETRIQIAFSENVNFTIGTIHWVSVPNAKLLIEEHSQLKYNKCLKGPPIYRQIYHLHSTQIVLEELQESFWTFTFPKLILRCWIDHEKRLVKEFTELVPQNPDIHVTRLRQIDVHTQLLCFYEQELSTLKELPKNRFLRKSTDKRNPNLQMCTINCVTQRMQVESRTYSVITFGAPAAHSLGFATTSMNEADKLVAYHANQVSKDQKGKLINMLQSFQSALKILKSGSFELYRIQGTEELQTRLDEVLHFANEITTLAIMISTSLKDLDEKILGGYQNEIKNRATKLVEEEIPRLAVKGHQLVLSLDADAFQNLGNQLSLVSDEIIHVQAGALALLEHHRLLMDAKFSSPTTWQSFRRRQDWTFSQCLSAVVTGFEETVQGWIDHKQYDLWAIWVKLGWLCEFESLLTAQGNELGILLDMKSALSQVENSVLFAMHPINESTSQSSESLESAPSVESIGSLTLTEKSSERIQIAGERGSLVVSLGVPFEFFERTIRHESKVRFCPVLFTQGINEQQVLSNVLGGSKTQDLINQQSVEKLKGYAQSYCEYLKEIQGNGASGRYGVEYVKLVVGHLENVMNGSALHLPGLVSTGSPDGESSNSVPRGGALGGGMSSASLRRMFHAVSGAVQGSSRSRNTDLLVLSSHLTRVLGSHCIFTSDQAALSESLPPFGSHPTSTTRFTSCKSAKDRTSMSVTLEQCMQLQASHGLQAHELESMLAAMRACGVRLQNVVRNVGRPIYSFNGLQWNFLPRLYRPPKHTANQGVQS